MAVIRAATTSVNAARKLNGSFVALCTILGIVPGRNMGDALDKNGAVSVLVDTAVESYTPKAYSG